MAEYMGNPPSGEERWDAQSRVSLMQVVGAVCSSIATLAFVLRIFTRLSLAKMSLRVDDYLIALSMVMCWAFYAITLTMAKYGGAGSHMWQTTASQYTQMLKLTLGLASSYILCSEVAKLSILFFYYKLSADRAFQLAVKIVMVVLVFYSLLYILLNIFGCIPVSDAWNVAAQAEGSAKCIDKGFFYLAAVVINVFIDFIIILLPLKLLVHLQMPLRQKISLFLLFGTGIFTIVAAIINSVLTVRLFKSDDYNWDITTELLWMYGELAGCVVSASASSLKPFFTKFLPTVLGWSVSADTENNTAGRYHSYGIKTIGQIPSRKPDDAIELESDDGNSSMRIDTDEEAQLWIQNARNDKIPDPSFNASVDNGACAYGKAHNTRPIGSVALAVNGINVLREVKVSSQLNNLTG